MFGFLLAKHRRAFFRTHLRASSSNPCSWKWNDDMWENLVAKHYSSGFLVESWMRGQQLGPYCPPKYGQEVVDAETLYVTDDGTNITWTETQDHAKWGVSLDSSYVICIGDINRMISQRSRGGGAVCFSNRKLCHGMYNTVRSSSVCPAHESEHNRNGGNGILPRKPPLALAMGDGKQRQGS